MKGFKKTRHFLISGRVQGVGFRYFAELAARETGVAGWVRNLDDGRVEAQASGSTAQLDDFEARLRKGPPRADVRGFESREDSPGGMPGDASGFHIR